MFAARYFAPRYFPSRYFGGAAAAATDLPALSFVLEVGPRFTLPRLAMHTLALNTDLLLRLRGVKVFDPTSGLRILATGITLAVRIAETPTGAAIDGSLQVTLTERAAGDFYAVLQGSDLETHLRTFLGELVYLVPTVGSGDFLGHRALRVIDGVALEG